MIASPQVWFRRQEIQQQVLTELACQDRGQWKDYCTEFPYSMHFQANPVDFHLLV